MPFFGRHEKKVFFLLTLAAGVFFLFPYHDFQLHLAQGDHGRDLYAFAQTMKGATPYRDYWWVYGPAMPYYYGIVMHNLGVSVHSVLIGYQFVNLAAGLLFYLCLSVLTPLSLALCGAVWFWVFSSPFEHTYNHIGGIALLNALYFILFLYTKKQEEKYIYLGAATLVALGLVKYNFGASSLCAFMVSILLVDTASKNTFTRKKLAAFLTAAIGVPLLTQLIYLPFVYGLSVYEIRQCFPFLPSDHPHHASVFSVVMLHFKRILHVQGTHWSHNVLLALLVLSSARLLHLKVRDKLARHEPKPYFLAIAGLAVFYIFNLHEFWLSGVTYRTYWVKPIEILWIFLIIALAAKKYSWKVLLPVVCIILTCAYARHWSRVELLRQFKTPERYINHERVQVYTLNSPDWLNTVSLTTNYLARELKEDETFLVFVDDALYYFLSGRKSPTRVLSICKHLNIHTEQEKEIILALENKQVNTIVLSNRQNSPDPSMGKFGVDYCPLLYVYLDRHFKQDATIGNWFAEPRWFEHHAVKTFKRERFMIGR